VCLETKVKPATTGFSVNLIKSLNTKGEGATVIIFCGVLNIATTHIKEIIKITARESDSRAVVVC
jgi:hypothetical protein